MNNWVLFNTLVWILCAVLSWKQGDNDSLLGAMFITVVTGLGYLALKTG